MAVHWTVRILSLAGIAATLTTYVVVTRSGADAGDPAVQPPVPPSSSPRWEPPVGSTAVGARAAFLGDLKGAVGDIPLPARAAYDRAARVIKAAQPACHLDWALLAGVGWVETQHGTRGGSSLDATGTMEIPLYGPALAAVDTDAGEYDERDDIDRPVGPLQFLPAAWATVAVDADGDGKRDPQNVRDAALGLGVLLCAGSADLAEPAQVRSALERFNGVEGYAAAVLRAARHYRATAPSVDALAAADSAEMVLVRDPSETLSPTATPSTSPSSTTSPTPSATPTPTPKPTPTSVTKTPKPSASVTASATAPPTAAPSRSASPTASSAG